MCLCVCSVYKLVWFVCDLICAVVRLALGGGVVVFVACAVLCDIVRSVYVNACS